MDGRLLAKDRLEVGGRERRRVERSDALAQREWPGEGLLHGDLLIQDEPDQQRHWVRRDQRVGLVGVGEVEAIGHVATGD